MLIDKLKQITADGIPSKNPSLTTYFALSTNEKAAEKAFDTNGLCGQLVGLQLNKQLSKNFSQEQFIEKSIKKFHEKIEDTKYINVIKDIYFSNNSIPHLLPLMYLSNPKLDTKTKKTFSIFAQMMQPSQSKPMSNQQLNFIEQDIFSLFNEHIEDKWHDLQSNSYLYFLDNTFTQDFIYLLSNQHYFHTQIDRFLKFYMFIYSSQLALNIHDKPLEKPSSQELYFILNQEKASSERKNLTNNGYKILSSKIKSLFPYLSLLENISDVIEDKDLKYYHFNDIERTTMNIQVIENLTKAYRESKSLSPELTSASTLEEAVQSLLNTTKEQFRTDKKAVLDRFLTAFEKQIAQPFIQTRGRSGKVTVLDQDTILLLTNLSIGNEKPVRFQELMMEFEKRGVFFDAKSRDALLELYERVGNIDRKSDSGDAVYVKSTI